MDNRGDLAGMLTGKGYRLRDDTDAELVLRAYECWGDDSTAKIIGDFAYVIWDARRRHLFCARDVLGIKPFHYFYDGRIFLCASELQQILKCSRVPREPNEGMVAEYLAGSVCNREETLFNSVFRLTPAHSLTVTAERVIKRRFFDLIDAKEIRYSTDREYADHYRELFKESVHCRLRGEGPVAFELSGGVDSSAVVGMAKHLLDSGSIRPDGFEVFSLAFSDPESDEKSFQDDVVGMLQLGSHRLAAGPTDPKVCAAQAARYLDVPDFPNGQMMYPMMDLARQKGCRVYLTGEGGDHWLTGSNLYCADLMRQLRFIKLVRRLQFDQHRIGALGPINRRPAIWRMFARGGLRPLAAQVLPAAARKRFRRIVGANSIPPFLDSEFAKRVHLAERLRPDHGGLRCSSFAQQTMYDIFNNSWETHTYELSERSASWHGFDARYSFHDRRLIEFVFGLPEEQRRRDDLTKFVLRNAIAELVPDSVRLRRTKAEFSPQFLKAFESIDGSIMLENLAINRLGWVSLQKVIKLYNEMLDLS